MALVVFVCLLVGWLVVFSLFVCLFVSLEQIKSVNGLKAEECWWY